MHGHSEPARREVVSSSEPEAGRHRRCSEEQLRANRRNALKSTGPRTPEGKAAAARNATKHGLLAERLVLERESREEFDALAAGLMAELAPVGRLETMLAERIVAAAWRLTRAMQVEGELVWQDLHLILGMRPHPDHAADTHEVTPASMMAERMLRDETYDRYRRYETHIERGLYRALHELQRLQAARKGRDVPLPGAIDVQVSGAAKEAA